MFADQPNLAWPDLTILENDPSCHRSTLGHHEYSILYIRECVNLYWHRCFWKWSIIFFPGNGPCKTNQSYQKFPEGVSSAGYDCKFHYTILPLCLDLYFETSYLIFATSIQIIRISKTLKDLILMTLIKTSNPNNNFFNLVILIFDRLRWCPSPLMKL